MHEIKQKEEPVKIRIELRVFVRHFIKFCLQRIVATLCEFLIHHKIMDTKTVNVIWKKFQELKDEKQKRSQTAVLNLTGKDVDENVNFLLNIAPFFVSAPNSLPYMEIVAAIESDALNLQSDKKDTSAKSLPQTVSKILAKIIGKKQ